MRRIVWSAYLLAGCASFRSPAGSTATRSRCLTGEAAAHLREIVGRIVAAEDSVARATADSTRLPRGASVRLVSGRSATMCDRAATAYARDATGQGERRPVVPVVVLRVGNRIVVGDTATTPTSEWAMAAVYTPRFRLVSRFLF